MNESLPLRKDSSRRDPRPQSIAVEEALLGQRPTNRNNAPFRRIRRHPLVSEAPRVRRLQPRCGQRLQNGIVLAADEVQGPSVEPSDYKRAGLRQRLVYVCHRQTDASRTDRETRTTSILRLDRQQSLDNRDRIAQPRAGQQLPCEPLNKHRHSPKLAPTTKWICITPARR